MSAAYGIHFRHQKNESVHLQFQMFTYIVLVALCISQGTLDLIFRILLHITCILSFFVRLKIS